MGNKIFISYKYSDSSVYQYGHGINNPLTVRNYVDCLQKELERDNHINKGEKDGEDLSDFKDDTIESKLRDKIYDSSVTIVLISPKMKDYNDESEQWIPWEISYSLKEINRENRKKTPNGIIALVLPDRSNSYDYFISKNNCFSGCSCTHYYTNNTFSIIGNNLFNLRNPEIKQCPYSKIYYGNASYIVPVKWKDFFDDMDKYIKQALENRDNISDFDVVKIV